MKTGQIVQTLGLAVMLGVSAGALAHGNDDYWRSRNGPDFSGHPAFQDSLRLRNEVNVRQDRQRARILNGRQDRRINPAEFRRLMDAQRDIRRMERAFLADGFLSRFEYRRLDAALVAARRNIYREGHDAERRPAHGGWQSSHGYGSWHR